MILWKHEATSPAARRAVSLAVHDVYRDVYLASYSATHRQSFLSGVGSMDAIRSAESDTRAATYRELK